MTTPQISKGHLIDLVCADPLLWDSRIIKRYGKDEKIEVWDSIGDQLKVSGRAAQKAWESLRAMFRSKLKRLVEKGEEANWEYFSAMNFMREVVNLGCVRVSNVTSSTSIKEEPVDPLTIQEHQVNVNVSQDRVGQGAVDYKYRDTGTPGFDDPVKDSQIPLELERSKVRQFEQQLEHNLTRKRKCEDDEDYMFLMSLLPSIQELDRMQKMHLRMEMLTSVTRELQNKRFKP